MSSSLHRGQGLVTPCLSIKAEPRLEDDFEAEVEYEAQAYQDQRDQARGRKRRKTPRIAGPTPPRKSRSSSEVDLARKGSAQEEHGSHSEMVWTADMKAHHPLHYNPLYRLAGLPDPAFNRSHATPFDCTAESRPPSFGGDDRTRTGSEEPAEQESISQDVEDGYEYDEDVVIPGSHHHTLAENDGDSISLSSGYSDDDVFGENRQLHEEKGRAPSPDSATSMTFRPNFETETTQGQILLIDADHPDVAVPKPINQYLKDYQRDGVRFLYGKYKAGRGGVLGDDMGLGKTIQVIAFLSAIMRKTGGSSRDFNRRKNLIRAAGKIEPKHWPTALIVCPKFLLQNWQRELDTWGYFEHAIWNTETLNSVCRKFSDGWLDIVLTSYEMARNHIAQLKDWHFSVVVADEAHRLKEPKAGVTVALKQIQCSSRFALSGTLVQNRIDEIWSVLDFVDPGQAGTFEQWREFAVNPIKRGHRHDGSVKEVINGIHRLGLMYHTVLPYFYLRRDKRLIAHELPKKRDMVVFCPLAARQIRAYESLIASSDVQFIIRRHEPCECESGKARIRCHYQTTELGEELHHVILKYINALTKVANHFGLLYHASSDSPETIAVNKKLYRICTGHDYGSRHQTNIEASLDPGNCGKWLPLAEMLRKWQTESSKNKVLIFSNSVRLLKMIHEFIATSFSGFAFNMITGEVATEERMRMVDSFQDPHQDHFILLISTLAGGVGLNLTAANKVVIFDPSWNPANDLQAMDRAFRLGQKRTVDVYRLIGQGTLEELIYERQIHKQQKARQLNDGTFESRMHQGFDGAKTVEDQGELFGTHNIFKFNPDGFVPGRLERVRLAEDRFVQDLIETEFSQEWEEQTEDVGNHMLRERLARAKRMAKDKSEAAMLNSILGEEQAAGQQDDSVLDTLGISAQLHDSALKDSPEERKIYELGLKLLRDHPDMASNVKANDLGKVRRSRVRGTTGAGRKEADPDAEPWKDRFDSLKSGKRRDTLAELSD